jgi:DNA-directed RNA polymerase specialized sigma subunit
LLHHFAGLSQREVAVAVGISQIHVSRLYREALTKLRAEIGEEAA